MVICLSIADLIFQTCFLASLHISWSSTYFYHLVNIQGRFCPRHELYRTDSQGYKTLRCKEHTFSPVNSLLSK